MPCPALPCPALPHPAASRPALPHLAPPGSVRPALSCTSTQSRKTSSANQEIANLTHMPPQHPTEGSCHCPLRGASPGARAVACTTRTASPTECCHCQHISTHENPACQVLRMWIHFSGLTNDSCHTQDEDPTLSFTNQPVSSSPQNCVCESCSLTCVMLRMRICL